MLIIYSNRIRNFEEGIFLQKILETGKNKFK